MLDHPLSDAPDVCKLTISELAMHYAEGSLSPVEVTQAVLARAHAIQDRYNAFSWIDDSMALNDAREAEKRWRSKVPLSPLDGVPTTVKDVLAVKGSVISYGSRAFGGVCGDEDAPAVQRLRGAGAVFAGITTSPEFGWKGVTDSPGFGSTLNPWDPSLTAGGSSGGAAVAASTGAGYAHVGTDGGGSTRIPAAFCGIVGFKPTFGQVAMFPPSAFGSLSHVGPMARTVADVALMFRYMRGRDIRDWTQPGVFDMSNGDGCISVGLKNLRIGYWSKPENGLIQQSVQLVVSQAIRNISSAGAIVEEVSLPCEEVQIIFEQHWFAAAAAKVASIPAEFRGCLDPGLLGIADLGKTMAGDLVTAQLRRADFGRQMDLLLSQHDFLISPAVGVEPFAHGHEVPQDSNLSRWTDWAGFTYPINLSQQPACVIPCGFTESGLPVGMQIVGARGRDFEVLAFAELLEQSVSPFACRTT